MYKICIACGHATNQSIFSFADMGTGGRAICSMQLTDPDLLSDIFYMNVKDARRTDKSSSFLTKPKRTDIGVADRKNLAN